MIDKSLLLISHVADPDGITPVIMAREVFKKVDTILINPGEVDKNLKENLDKYDVIHITDLNVSPELASFISENEEYCNKVRVIDHHISGIELDKYSFITVIDERDGRKESATSLYYEYLLSISSSLVLRKDSLKGLVEQVRIIDTYDFKSDLDEEAHNIDALFSILGRENYIDYFTTYIHENDCFEYNSSMMFLVKLEQDKMRNYLEQREQDLSIVSLDGHKAGLIYAERYRSDLAQHMLRKFDDLDMMIIIRFPKNISYRSNDKVDLSGFSKKYGGGGHKNAAGSPLPKDLLEKVTKMIYPDIEFLKEEENE